MLNEHLSDQELLFKIKQNDVAAFDIFFEKYWDKLYKTAFARLNDTQEAKDIVQELLINFWNRKASIEINTNLENYLFGALKFSVINHFRSLKMNELRLQEAVQRMSVLETSVADIEDYLELEKVLAEAVKLMPETLQKIYALRCDDVPIKEIGNQLGLADQTVKNYTSNILRSLRQTIAQKYPEKNLTYTLLLLALLNK